MRDAHKLSDGPEFGKWQPDQHRRQTEGRLVLGGFALIVIIGSLLLWLLYGLTIAVIALVIVLGAAVIFAVLSLLLRVLGEWARGD